MKIKDLPPDKNMKGVKVRTSKGMIGYWEGQWDKGVWLSPYPESKVVIPVIIENLKETLEWEVIEEGGEQ